MTTTTAEVLPVFDFYELSAMDDPYPLYAEWRAVGPLIKGGPGQWGVTRHAQVAACLKDRRLVHEMPKAYTDFMMGPGESSEFRQNSLLMIDGPAHHRLRHLIGQAFTPALVRQLQARIEGLVDEMIQPLLAGEAVNLVEALAFPLPVAVICELMGLDPADAPDVRRHSAKIMGADHPASDEAVRWMRAYMEDALRRRHPDPDGDLLDRMLAATDEDTEGLTHAEIIDNAVLLFFGGFETTRHLIASGAWALAHHPDQFALLRGPEAVEWGVEELLRYDSPVRTLSVMATEPVSIGPRVIKAGQVLYLLLGSANHDDTVFARPGELDVCRRPNPHVSFGGGPHRCLGMHLARLEAQVVFRRLAERFEALEPAGEAVRAVSTLSTYAEVPVRGRARARDS